MPKPKQIRFTITEGASWESVLYGEETAQLWEELRESTGLNNEKLLKLMIATLHVRLLAESQGATILMRKDGAEKTWPLPGELYKPHTFKLKAPG